MKRSTVLIVAVLLLGSCFTSSLKSFAQSGSLDLTFDTDGKVTTVIGSATDVGNSVAIQSDGKIVVAGYSENATNSDFAVVRYNPDGSLDTGFGNNGKVTTDLGGYDDIGNSVALQTDGKIVVAGYGRVGTNTDVAVVRYNIDGSLDLSFDTDGIVTTPIGNSSDYGFAVAIQLDGKIVVAGSSQHFAVVRYNTDGSLDNTFGNNGIVTTDVDNASEGLCIALQADGKIVVAGYANDIYTDIVVVRYNTDGSLDQSFDSDGIVTTDIWGLNDKGYSVAIQSDGKIVLGGISYEGLDSNFEMVRYNTDGSLDGTFGNGGIVTTDIASFNESIRSMVIQSDSKIVVSGLSIIGSSAFIVVVRYDSNGVLDVTFDGDGIVTTNIGAYSEGQSITIQTDGKIVVAGSAIMGGNLDFAVARYNNTITIGVNAIVKPTPEISIFPNPFSTQATLHTDPDFDNATITLYNSYGQTIKQIINVMGQSFTLHRDNLPNGLYHILITQDGKSIIADKFVITD